MMCNIIHFKNKSNFYYNHNKIFKLFIMSLGKYIINLKYNIYRKESSNLNLKVIHDKNYIKKNIGKMIYKATENNKEIRICNKKFISNNIKRAKLIINNKQYKLEENIVNKKQFLKIEIKFIDNIIELNSMFKDCNLLSSIYKFQNFDIYLIGIYIILRILATYFFNALH